MEAFAESTIFSNATNQDGSPIVIEVKSQSNPNKMYRVDLTNGRCSCPAWIHQKGGVRKPCKHLRSLGYSEILTMPDVSEPQKASSQTVKELAK